MERAMLEKRVLHVSADQVGPMIAALKADGFTNVQQEPEGGDLFTLIGVGDTVADPAPLAEPGGAAQVDLSSIAATKRPIAQKILDAFANAGFGTFQQVAALANAIHESNLDPIAHSPPPEESIGLFQLNHKQGLGVGHSIQSLEDPDTNIDIIIEACHNVGTFKTASSLADAVAEFVSKIERPANQAVEIATRRTIANRLLRS
jgi:hypothetical protein